MNTPHHQLFGLPESVVEKIRIVFQKHPDIQRVLLYGSRAKGNYQLGSDIDLCLEAEKFTLTQLLKVNNELDDLLLPWKVDLSLKHDIDNQTLLDHISEVGIVFYP